jgi:GNAT superfamily N-acetyltransferase
VLRFRFATFEDVPAIVQLVESAYRGPASRRGWTTEAELLDGQRTDAAEVGELLQDLAARLILALDEGLVASIAVRRTDAGLAHIGMFAVSPERQAGGVGRALLAEAERVGAEVLGCATGEMTVIRQRDTLLAWYARRGWSLTGETEPFPYGDARFGLPRRDDLEFLVLHKALLAPSSGQELAGGAASGSTHNG